MSEAHLQSRATFRPLISRRTTKLQIGPRLSRECEGPDKPTGRALPLTLQIIGYSHYCRRSGAVSLLTLTTQTGESSTAHQMPWASNGPALSEGSCPDSLHSCQACRQRGY